jgi:tetratricopeptide (TPR) repeat protein
MQAAIDKGVLPSNLTNLTFLSQSWSAAKENEKALPVMMAAAQLSENGELDAQLGQVYLNMENFDKAIEASQRALVKGKLRNEGTTYLVLGMAHFNKGQFAESLNNLAKAEQYNTSKLVAKQWAKYVSGEKNNQERLRNELSSMGS